MVEESIHRQNNRILTSSRKATPEDQRYVDQVQNHFLLVRTGVSAYSRTSLVFVPQGAKINTQSYQKLILDYEIKSIFLAP